MHYIGGMSQPQPKSPVVSPHRETFTYLKVVVAVLMSSVYCCGFAFAAERVLVKTPVLSLAFSPDGANLIATSQEGLRIYRWPSLDLISNDAVEASSRLIAEKVETPHTVTFSRFDSVFTVAGGIASQNGALLNFSWPEFDPLQYSVAHSDSVMAACWMDTAQIASGSMDGEIIIRANVDQTSGSKSMSPTLKLRGHSKGVTSLCLADDQHLISGGIDHSLRVWNLKTHKVERTLNQHAGVITDLAPSPVISTPPIVASSSEDQTVRLWQPTIGRLIRFTKLEATPLKIAWLANQDRDQINLLIAACSDGTIQIIDPQTATVIKQIETDLKRIFSLTLHPSDDSAAVGGDRGQIIRINLDVK